MILSMTHQGFKLNDKTNKQIQKHLEKLTKRLPHINPDLSKLHILIKKHPSKYTPKRHNHHAYTDFTDRKGSMAKFEGSIYLNLPVRKLYAQFRGRSIEDSLRVGIDRLYKELKKYKDRHFKSQSEYPIRDSIRKIPILKESSLEEN